MKLKKRKSLVCSTLFLFSPLIVAQEQADKDVQLLRKQLEQLKAAYIQQAKAINYLEGRLKQIEAGGKKVGSPARKAPATQQTAPKPTVARAKPTKQAQPPAKEEKIVKEAPRKSSVSAVLQEEHALFDNRFTIEVGATYSSFDRAQINLSGFLALDAIFLGQISVDQVKSDVLTMDVTGRYGITDRIQVDVNVPFLYRNTNFFEGNVNTTEGEQEGGSPGEADVTLNPTLGDISAGVFFQVLPEATNWPDIVWNVRVKAPTGTEPYGIGTVDKNGIEVPKELPTGNGVWAVSTGLSFVKTIDPAVLFANLNYFHNFEQDFDNFGGGQPGSIDLGNAYQFGLGIAFAINERLSMNFSYTQRLSDKARTKSPGTSWQSIIGSDANSASFNTGVTFALTKSLTLVTNVGIGLTSDAPDVQLGIKLPYRF